MTATYYIADHLIVTTSSIGVSIERYHSADYWKVRLYLEDIFTSTVMTHLIPNTTTSISIVDGSTITYTGTIGYFGTEEDYSYVDLVNCTLSFTPAP